MQETRRWFGSEDPPFPIFGLPRIVSTRDDYAELFDAVPLLANGASRCVQALWARA